MRCPRCDLEMEIGQAIKPNYDPNAFYIAPVGYDSSPEIIECWKCPKCGFSEFLDDTSSF